MSIVYDRFKAAKASLMSALLYTLISPGALAQTPSQYENSTNAAATQNQGYSTNYFRGQSHQASGNQPLSYSQGQLAMQNAVPPTAQSADPQQQVAFNAMLKQNMPLSYSSLYSPLFG